jgi:group I intron endonuclease
MKKEYFVYMHTSPSGKRYIGITCCAINRRWQNGYGYVTQPFYRAIKKYGWDNFTHEILADNLTAEEAGELEQKYIAKYQSNNRKYGYNVMPGGEVGFHLSEEHKKKIGSANAGKKNGMYGHRYTDEEKQRIAKYWLGKKHTPESIEKMKIAQKKRIENGWKPLSGKSHPNSKAVIQYDLDGNYIQKFDTAVEAEQITGTARAGICNSAKGKGKTAGGYIWKYEDDLLSSDKVTQRLTTSECKKRTTFRFNYKSVEWKIRKVDQYDLNGNYIRSFDSIAEAQKSIGKPNGSTVSAVCRGKLKNTGGYVWRYRDGL